MSDGGWMIARETAYRKLGAFMRGGSCRMWQQWPAALVGATLAVSGAGGVAVAAEQIAADAPVPTDPRAFGGYYVMSPYVQSDFGRVPLVLRAS